MIGRDGKVLPQIGFVSVELEVAADFFEIKNRFDAVEAAFVREKAVVAAVPHPDQAEAGGHAALAAAHFAAVQIGIIFLSTMVLSKKS